jgi:hypothetical protein
VLTRVEADEAFRELVGQDHTLAGAGQHPKRHQQMLEYLARHREATPAERLKQIDKLLEETRGPHEDDLAAWKQARGMALDKPEDYERKVEQIRAYIGRADALNKEEGGQLIETLLQQAQIDTAAYEQLGQLSKGAKSSAQILELEARAQAYLNTGDHGKTRRGAVESYVKELARFKQQPRQVRINVKSIRIPEAFLNRTWTGNPVTSVTVKVDGTSFTANKVNTRNVGDFLGDVEQTLGPYPVTWGRKQTLEVKMEVHRVWFANETASVMLSDDVYVLNHANGTVQLKAGYFSSTAVGVTLECAEATAPSLPSSP